MSGLSPFTTPNDDFYRIDTALVVPQVPTEDWSCGCTAWSTASSADLRDLLARDLVETDITLTCVSNEVGGNLRRQRPVAGLPGSPTC